MSPDEDGSRVYCTVCTVEQLLCGVSTNHCVSDGAYGRTIYPLLLYVRSNQLHLVATRPDQWTSDPAAL